MEITITDAIRSLIPNPPTFYIESGKITGWDVQDDKTNILQPTEVEIAAELTRLQSIYTSLEYSRLRKIEYNKLEQDEMRYDDFVNGTTTWTDAIAAIKLSIPKPV